MVCCTDLVTIVLEAFSDASFAGDVRTRRSASCVVVAVYAAMQLHGQANRNGPWHCQQKQNLSQPVRVQRAAWLKCILENSVEKVVRYQRYMLTMQAQ